MPLNLFYTIVQKVKKKTWIFSKSSLERKKVKTAA